MEQEKKGTTEDEMAGLSHPLDGHEFECTHTHEHIRGFPGGSVVKKLPANTGDMGSIFLGWEDPLQEEMQPTPVLLPGKSHGQRSLAWLSPWGHEESNMTEHVYTCACTHTHTHTHTHVCIFLDLPFGCR